MGPVREICCALYDSPYMGISISVALGPRSILVSLISVIGFLLPSESGEKVSLQLTALLSYSLVFLVIVDTIPPVGGNFPLIGNRDQCFFYIWCDFCS